MAVLYTCDLDVTTLIRTVIDNLRTLPDHLNATAHA